MRKHIIIALIATIFIIAVKGQNQDVKNNKEYLKSNNDTSKNDYPNSVDIEFSTSLSDFVETIELKKICDHVKLYVIFTVDTAGKISNPDFKTSHHKFNDCAVDSVYVKELKVEFEKQIPCYKPFMKQDTIIEVRLSIPVYFD